MARLFAIKVPLEVIVKAAEFRGDLGQPEYCNVPDCARDAHCMSLCRAHYNYFQKYRTSNSLGKSRPDVETAILPYVQPVYGLHALPVSKRKCHVPGCYSKNYGARGLCKIHYKRYSNWRRENANKTA